MEYNGIIMVQSIDSVPLYDVLEIVVKVIRNGAIE